MTAVIRLKIAVHDPMPRPRVTMKTTVKAPIFAERTQAILQVLMELLDHSGAAGVAGLLARRFHSTERDDRLAPGFVGRHSSADAFGGLVFDVVA